MRWGQERSLATDAASAFLAFLALTVVDFWKVVSGISTVGIPTGDVYGNLWALDWASRHLLTPSRFFAANIFYPDPRSFAYTESLLAEALQSAPLLGLGVPLVAAYNVVFLLTFPLAGLGAYLLGRHLTGSHPAALLGGVSYAFSSYRFESLVHLQTLSIQWLPFVVLFTLLSLERASLPRLVALGVSCLLQALSSGYYAALLPPILGVILAFHAPWSDRRSLLRTTTALLLTALLAVPAFLPYLEAQRALGLARRRGEIIGWSASWLSYLRPSSQLAFVALGPLRRWVHEGPALYPGTLVLLFCAAALSTRRRHVALLALLAGVGVLLSLGPEVHLGPFVVSGPFEWLRHLPGYRLLRTPYRMAPIALVALSGLGAVGWSVAEARLPGFGRWGLLLLLLAVAEGYSRPTMLGELPHPRPFASWLKDAPKGPVLEIPWTTYDGLSAYTSVTHRQPLVNGWGAFAPPSAIRLGMWGERWPGPGAVHVLRGAGVRYVVVHTRGIPEAQEARLRPGQDLPRGVVLLAEAGEDWIYAISAEGPGDPPEGQGP